jgi:hypothetical protein
VGYRSETEARRERIERLEHELAIATTERDEVVRELEAARVQLERLADLETENGALRAGALPTVRRAHGIAVLVGVVAAVGFAAMLLANRADMEAARATTELLHETVEAERARRIEAESWEPVPGPRPITGLPTPAAGDDEDLLPIELLDAARVVRRFETARVVETSGPTDRVAGETCVVTLRHDGGPVCRMDVRCAGADVYPGAGHAGLLRCHVGDGADVTASDVHASAVSGDPLSRLDGSTATLEISDGATDLVAWGITIALGEAS